jgi:PAS domain S-box-containing protein
MFTVDHDLNITHSNQAWNEIFSEVSSLSPSMETSSLAAYLRDPSSVYPIHVEVSLEGKNEVLIPYTWTVLSSDKKSFNFYGYYLGPAKDLETRYERIYNSTTDAIMLLSPERFTDCNQATLKIFKLKSVEEFTKCHPADLSPPVQPDGESSFTKANRMIDRALSEGRAFFEWTHRTSEGVNFPCEVLLSRLELNGTFYLQASVRDISNRVRLQKEIEDVRIAQINSSKLISLGEMAAGIAHEINNPMTIIRVQAELLQRILKKPDEVKTDQIQKGLALIGNTVDRISKIIKGLRAISRNSSQDPMIEHELLDIFQDTSALFEEKFKSSQIGYELNFPSHPVRILCRPEELSQVILNLMNNSFDAINGSVAPWVRVTVTCDEKKVYLKFTDSGTGIPEKIRGKIFEPFFTSKEVGKGTGLGLSISRSIIEMHGGQFSYEQSEPNTTFQIVLPLSGKK